MIFLALFASLANAQNFFPPSPNGVCYEAQPSPAKEMDFTKTICEGKGMTMLEVYDDTVDPEAELAYAFNHANDLVGMPEIWLGYTEIGNTETFARVSDGTPAGWTNFKAIGGQKCVQARRKLGWKWVDVGCGNSAQTVCQKRSMCELTIENSNAKTKVTRKAGQIFDVACDVGYVITTSYTTLTCQCIETWDLLPPKCVPNYCRELTLVNGQISPPQTDFLPGNTISFQCSSGFYLAGVLQIRCILGADSAKLSAVLPQCVPETPPAAEPTPNLDEGLKPGQGAEFQVIPPVAKYLEVVEPEAAKKSCSPGIEFDGTCYSTQLLIATFWALFMLIAGTSCVSVCAVVRCSRFEHWWERTVRMFYAEDRGGKALQVAEPW